MMEGRKFCGLLWLLQVSDQCLLNYQIILQFHCIYFAILLEFTYVFTYFIIPSSSLVSWSDRALDTALDGAALDGPLEGPLDGVGIGSLFLLGSLGGSGKLGASPSSSSSCNFTKKYPVCTTNIFGGKTQIINLPDLDLHIGLCF